MNRKRKKAHLAKRRIAEESKGAGDTMKPTPIRRISNLRPVAETAEVVSRLEKQRRARLSLRERAVPGRRESNRFRHRATWASSQDLSKFMPARALPGSDPDPGPSRRRIASWQSLLKQCILILLALAGVAGLIVCAVFFLFPFLASHEEAVASVNPPAPDPRAERMAELSKVAMVAFGAHDYENAHLDYEEMTTLDPNSVQAWNNVGLTLVAQKRFEEALEPLARAITLDPDRATLALMNRSFCLRMLKRSGEARTDLESAVKLSPSDPIPNNLLLLARIESGERESVEAGIRAEQELSIPSLEPLSIGAIIGLAIADGNIPTARIAVERARQILTRRELVMILNDPFLAPHAQILGALAPGKADDSTEDPKESGN